MTEQLIALIEVADELETHKSVVFKIAARLGIETVKQRDPERRNQIVSFVSTEDARRIRSEYSPAARSEEATLGNGDLGWFYIIQLEPELDPGRFKAGFTVDPVGRLRKHRCTSPFATLHAKYPSHRRWEFTAIDCVTRDAEQLGTEVFRVDDLTSVHELARSFFDVMPQLTVDEEDG